MSLTTTTTTVIERAKQEKPEECHDLWPEEVIVNIVVCRFFHSLNMSEFLFLIKPAVLDFSIQGICWAVAAFLKTEKFYDLAGKYIQDIFYYISSVFPLSPASFSSISINIF